MKFSDLSRDDINALRIMAEVERAYPHYVPTPGKLQPSKVLAGYAGWRAKRRDSIASQSQPLGAASSTHAGPHNQHFDGGR